MKLVVLVTYLDGAFAWPALYGAIVVAVLLCLLVAATVVALFDENEERANRAVSVVKELVRLFRWWSK